MKKILFYSTIYFILFFIFVLAPNTTIGFIGSNVWGVIGYGVGIYYLWYMIGRLKNKIFWSLIFSAIVVEFIGEGIWAYRELVLHVEPSTIFVEFCYLLMPILITVAIVYNLIMLKKVSGVLKKFSRSLPEIVYFSYITYLLFFSESTIPFSEMSIWAWFTLIFLLCDLFMLLIMIIFFVENSTENMKTKVVLLQTVGGLIYVLTDLIYIYLRIYSYYETGNVIDPLWSLGIGLIILSAYYEVYEEDSVIDIDSLLLNNNKKIRFELGILGISGLILVSTRDIQRKEKISMTIFLLISYISISQVGNFIERNNLKKLNTELSGKVEEINKLNRELVDKNNKLKSIVYLDFLTSLGNRRYLEKEIKKSIKLVEKKIMSKFAIVLIDLNRFKSINDWYGHDIGDKLIIEVSRKLKKVVYRGVAVARQGGDEFILLIPNISDDSYVRTMMEIVVEAFKKPIVIKDNEFIVNLSIGVAIYPDDGLDQRTLLKNSDMAMYRSKKKGDNEIVFYHKDNEADTLRKIRIEHLLKHVKFEDEFSIYYQPQIEINSEESLIGFEALVRWNNRELGFISPGEFIAIAEETGTIMDISNWVLRKAIKQISLWNKEYKTNIKIGINISPKYFSSTNFVSEINKIVEENNIDTNYIDLEITEEVSMKNQDSIQMIIHSLKKKGYQISIDDFGTGYSSFSYLRSLNFDTLKIAMPFVRGIHKNEQDFQIVKAIINMAKILGMRVIAEGVEKKQQLDKLKELGCDRVQGYYFSKPLQVGAAEEFIKAWLNRCGLKINDRKD